LSGDVDDHSPAERALKENDMITARRIIASLTPLALCFACGTESGTLPSQIDGLSASARHQLEDQEFEDDDAPQFSSWSAPVNLGPPINGAVADGGSFISKDGLSFYVSSTRPGG